MEKQASIPVTLPREKPTISYWQDPPIKLEGHIANLTISTKADIVIIGSGITGSSLAYNLTSRPGNGSKKILMLEARTACSGATGRNGGHTKCGSYRSFLDNVKSLGEEEAVKIVRFEHDCMKSVHAFAREKGIECDSWEGDTVDIIYDEAQWTAAKESVKKMRVLLGEDDPAATYRFWDSKETETRFLTAGAVGSLTYSAGSISAYKFAMGVLKLAMDMGLHLHTSCPVTNVERTGNKWFVMTQQGKVETEKVVFCTNGYTAHLLPQLQGKIVPLRGVVQAHRPGSNMPQEGLPYTYSFVYENGYEYMISRPEGSHFEGDIVIGGGLTKAPGEGLLEYGNTDDETIDSNIGRYLDDSAIGYFGSKNWGEDNPHGRIRRQWSGIMGYSADGFPLVGKIPQKYNMYIAASFQGHGMVLCFSAAKALAEMMDDNTTNLHELDSWFPRTFRISLDRMSSKFQGRLHTKAPTNLEMRSQQQ
ncbi:hypothetical protein MMC09_003499 [Bachmanniomyces sp. S44760]|nr:hypothetical protein [Bachmanniomyces sp. S44760]